MKETVRRVLIAVGLVLTLIGASMADTEGMILPTATIVIGAVMVLGSV